MRRGSLRLRLMLAGAVSILVALTLSALGLSFLFERHAERRVVIELGVWLDQVVAGLEQAQEGNLFVTDGPADPRFGRPLSGFYWQVETSNSSMRSRSLWDFVLPSPISLPGDGGEARFDLAGPDGSDLIAVGRYVTLPQRLGGDRIKAVVALDFAEIAAARRAFTADLLPYLAVIGAVLLLAAYAQIVVGLKPLAAVRNRLSAIRLGERNRLGREFPDEILPLAAEVDALLEAREKQVDKARTRASDLAHGLNTPLQVLAGDVVRLREKGEESIARDIEQVASTMQRHVEREMVRARTATQASTAQAPVADVVDGILKVVSRTPAGERITCSSSVPADIAGRIDADDLAEAIGNLVENAVRHAVASVTISATREGENVVIRVRDDGPGIPPERLEQALARGGRLDQMGGAGLGLAIVREIAEAWSGRLEVRTDPQGFEATIIVPVADTADG